MIQEGDYTTRYKEMLRLVTGHDKVRCIETVVANNRQDVEQFHTKYTKEGYEGIMLRTPKSLYQQQYRSKDLLKYKIFKDAEYEVVGHHEGTGGTAVFDCKTKDGKTFGVTMKCSLDEKKEMLSHAQEYYGKQLTVKFQELSLDGIPRFPVGIGFRVD